MSKQRDEEEEEEMTLSVWLKTWAIPCESEEVIESIRYEFEQHDIKDVKELSQRNLRLNVMKAMGIKQYLAENIKNAVNDYISRQQDIPPPSLVPVRKLPPNSQSGTYFADEAFYTLPLIFGNNFGRCAKYTRGLFIGTQH